MNFIKSDTILARAIRAFLLTLGSVIVTKWIAADGGHTTITGLGNAIGDNWDFGAGSGLLAAIGTFGFFKLPGTPNPPLK